MKAENALRRARRYLERRGDRDLRPLESGDVHGVQQVVVIPVLAEGEWLFATLASLARNDEVERRRTLVICVVNNRPWPLANEHQVADNQDTLRRLEALVGGVEAAPGSIIEAGSLRLGVVDASSPGREIGAKAGVGEARKIGLDHGLAVLCKNGDPRGPLLCLDADTLVAPCYLRNVREHFESRETWAAVVAYEHPLPDEPNLRAAIVNYELFLRYHELGLRLAGSPYAFPTIGSTIATRADAYVAVGGMNKRQAGEDFYFLQQLAKTGDVSRIDETTVYPSARPSDRVPFGTGASVARFLAGRRDNDTVYNPDVYSVIAGWLRTVTGSLERNAHDLLERAAAIDPYLERFLVSNRFEKTWPRLQQNAPDRFVLERQFHRWFDAFKSLKLIHSLRDQVLPEIPIFLACREILDRSSVEVSTIDWEVIDDDPETQISLLNLMRRACAS